MRQPRQPAFDLPRWQTRAACRPYPTWWWFTNDGAESVEAFVICTGCEVSDDCLDFALDHPELSGIWAATTDADRDLLQGGRSRAHLRPMRPRSDPGPGRRTRD